MEVLILLLFVSLVLVAGALLLFFRGVVTGDLEDGDRLSLLPLEPEKKTLVVGEASSTTGLKATQVEEGA